MPTEADTCRKFVVPLLQAAGWDNDPHRIGEQRSITDGRIVPVGQGFIRRPPKRADYLLFYTRDFPLAVVEAKASYKKASDGLQQAKGCAQTLGLQWAYATNGHEIIEFDFFTGQETTLASYPSPDELWQRYRSCRGLADDQVALQILEPFNHLVGKGERYYQLIAVNRVVEAILKGHSRLLVTMATGTGKTAVAFQICWKLWNARWTRLASGPAGRRPKILYLADRNILIDQPKDGIFAAFGDARHKIESGEVVQSREMYFALYQALAEDERREGLFKAFAPDFFDLVIVDECHRGSARDTSAWRAILEYFKPAYQLGMTATPLRDETRDTYLYFGNPIYEYSLRQGIEDGFLAPYRVHRVITEWDAAGWRPSKTDLDRYGRPIPDDEYQTKDFERVVALRARTQAIARHLTQFLKKTDRFAKTIVFCVDQEHASEMRTALNNLNADLTGARPDVAQASSPASSGSVPLPGTKRGATPLELAAGTAALQGYPDYVCRVTADEGDIGRGHLSRFQDVDTNVPAILTTSQLLTTGVDAPTCKNIVLARVVGSMTEFKQIIGRGTRVRDDYGKLWFNIIDYTGSATRLFADPDFDGTPVRLTEDELQPDGQETILHDEAVPYVVPDGEETGPQILEPPPEERKKYYFDGGQVAIAAQLVYELDPDGKQLRVIRYTDYAAEKVRTLCPTAPELRAQWADPVKRSEIIQRLEERGITFAELAEAAKQPDADPFDLLCYLAYNAPLRTRRERADRLRQDKKDFFDQFSPQAKGILHDLLEKYADHGTAQFIIPDILKVPPISTRGTIVEIAAIFGGPDKLRTAVTQLQTLLYAA